MVKKTEAIVRGTGKGKNDENGEPAFPCFRCGICCTVYQIYMTRDESYALAERLGISQLEFEYKHLDPRWPFAETVLLRQNAGRCLFLNQPADSIIGLCCIHEFKPFCCRQWRASRDHKECRQGLSRYWGLSVGEDGELEGSPEDILCFQTFIESLGEEEDT
jgi:Fe-S-cluster containining protein